MTDFFKWAHGKVNDRQAVRDYSKLPRDFERDAVRGVVSREFSSHFKGGNAYIRGRIMMRNAETFTELHAALDRLELDYNRAIERMAERAK